MYDLNAGFQLAKAYYAQYGVDVEKAIRRKLSDGVGNLYVLVNYTGLYSTHNILKRIEGESA